MKSKVNRNFKIIPLVFNILIPVLGGFLVSYINRNAISIYSNTVKKPFFTPPNMVFVIVWSILYVLMGFSSYRIYIKNKENNNDNGAYFFYLVQLLLNFMWSFIFFTFRLYGISFIWIIILFIFVVITFVKFIRIDKTAGFLLIPYMLWLVFAGIINYFVWVFNEM